MAVSQFNSVFKSPDFQLSLARPTWHYVSGSVCHLCRVTSLLPPAAENSLFSH